MLYFLFFGTSTEGSSYYVHQVNKTSSGVRLLLKMFPCDCRCQLSAWKRELISVPLWLQTEVRWAKDDFKIHSFEHYPLQYLREVCIMDKTYSKVVWRNRSLEWRVQ